MNSDLREASGLASSLVNTDRFYAHNDSGDSPRFFMLNQAGSSLGVVQVNSAKLVDWEDMARGPCGSATCLFFADMGDNQEVRGTYQIYRVREPQDTGDQTLDSEVMNVEYPASAEGPQSYNAETLLVHPNTGVLTVVTKTSSGASRVFDGSFTGGGTTTLTERGSLTPPTGSNLFTGGDVHPTGKGILLRTYTNVFFYPMSENQTVAQALTTNQPCALPVASETQGEAVAWSSSGNSYLTVSEGVGASVFAANCTW